MTMLPCVEDMAVEYGTYAPMGVGARRLAGALSQIMQLEVARSSLGPGLEGLRENAGRTVDSTCIAFMKLRAPSVSWPAECTDAPSASTATMAFLRCRISYMRPISRRRTAT